MTTERIDIQVTDKGADKAAGSLRAIGAEAKKSENYVLSLQRALAAANKASAGSRLKGAAGATGIGAINRELAALNKLNAAKARAASLAETAAAKEAKAQDRITAAVNRGIAARQAQIDKAQKAFDISSKQPAAAVGSRATNAGVNAQLHAMTDRIAASRRADAAASATQKAATDAVTAAQGRATGAATVLGGALGRTGAIKGRMGAQTANIAAQMNDLGVQFAMAAQSGNPLQMVMMALIQQGSQLSYIASTMQGGFRGLIGAMGAMLAPFLPLIIAAGVLVAALAKIKSEAASDAELKKFAGTLGLTKDEMKELKDVTVTWGDTFGAVMDVILQRAGTDSAQVTSWFKDAFSSIGEFAKFSVAIIYAAFFTGFRAIARVILGLPKIAGAAITAVVNGTTAAIEGLVNLAIKGINYLAQKSNSIFGTDFANIAEAGLGRVKNNFSSVFGDIGKGIKDDLYGSFKSANKLMDDIGTRAGQRARNRIGKNAKDIIADRSDQKAKKAAKPKVDNTAENRAHALGMVNLELDKELATMRLLKDERAIQQRMDQIETSLAQKKIKLNDGERASILAKVTAIEKYKYVQAEMDRMLEEIEAPARTLNATQEAANELFARGKMTLQQYTEALHAASRANAQATDQFFDHKEQIASAAKLTKYYGVALEKATYLEGLRLEALSKGKSIYEGHTGQLKAETAALVAKNDALRQQQFIQSQVGAIVNPMIEKDREIQARTLVYAELQRLRDKDFLSEQQHQMAKKQLWMAANAANLGIVSDGFGAIADATAKGHGVIGAISKAAAVAQAVIQGYVAVQNALATVPFPFNYIAAGAVALRAGVQVAGIMSTNAGSYATGGQFMVGGRSGIDANNINMNVTKGERVTIETAKQQRANDNQMPGAAAQVNAKIVNIYDRKEMMAAMDSDEGETLILNVLSRNPGKVAQIAGGR